MSHGCFENNMYAAITIGGQTGTTGDVVDDYNPVQHGVTMPTEAPVNAVIKVYAPIPTYLELLILYVSGGLGGLHIASHFS